VSSTLSQTNPAPYPPKKLDMAALEKIRNKYVFPLLKSKDVFSAE